MESWVLFSGWPDFTGTLHILVHLNCVPALQRAIHFRYRSDRWEQLSPQEPLYAVAGLVLQAANHAVKWEEFFISKQAVGDPMKRFFHRYAS